MKTFFISIIVALSFTARAQEIPKITPEQAKDFVGKTVTVCGEVKSTFVSKSGANFLDFGAAHPNNTFSVIIYPDDAMKFSVSPVTLYKGKTICVTGVVKLYKEKPEILVYEQKQIQEK